MTNLYKNDTYKLYFGIILILLWISGFILQIRRVVNYDDTLHGALMVATFFTNHANLFVCISTIFILLNINNKHTDRFNYIAAVDITITGIVWLTILLPFMAEQTKFLQILLHGIIPPLFLVYYFLFANSNLSRKISWISLIHPFLYFMFVYVIVHPLYGVTLNEIFPLDIDPYVYPFLNPAYFDRGFWGMLMTNYLFLFPIAFLLSFTILISKQRIEIKKKSISI